MQRDSLVTHENHMKTVLRVLSCSDMKDKDFLLKIYLENHKPRVDGNASACASTHQYAYQYSNQGYREGKHEISKRTSRMMRLKIKTIDTTNL